MNRRPALPAHDVAGLTLIEVMIALVILSIGIMAVARVLPTGSRTELSSRMQSAAAEYGSDVFESVRGMPRTNALLSVGRHPAADFDTMGTRKSWLRYYVVSPMPAPLDSCLRIDATVLWHDTRPESVHLSSYIRP